MLNANSVSVSYGQHLALDGVSVQIKPGEIVVILGANGAGKTTLLKALGGLVACVGQITMDGQVVSGIAAHDIVERGLALVPEGRGIFGDLSVQENLMLGANAKRARKDEAVNLNRVLGLFPKLMERQHQTARTMSGGEQQMVAIGRALMSAPSVLMLDEPSLGLSPLLCGDLFKALRVVRENGVGVLLVEQNARQSLAIADRAYLLENGRIVGEGSADEMMRNPAVQQAYLGGASTSGQSGAYSKTEQGAQAMHYAGQSVERSGQTNAKADQQAVIDKALASLSKSDPASTEISGSAIEVMVERATSIQRHHVAASTPNHSGNNNAPVTPSLENILADIEAAAAHAFNGIDANNNTTSIGAGNGRRPIVHVITPPAAGSTQAAATARAQSGATTSDSPKITVFRKPKIEVYRRKSADGPLERDD